VATYTSTLLRSREEKDMVKEEVYAERDRIISIIKNEMHKMQTPELQCYCDRCQDLTNLIITILKEKR
jgi:hypothetical protein